MRKFFRRFWFNINFKRAIKGKKSFSKYVEMGNYEKQ